MALAPDRAERRITTFIATSNFAVLRRPFKSALHTAIGVVDQSGLRPLLLDGHRQCPNRVWLADITYIPTAEGSLYLAAVMDLFSRKIVGSAMRDHMQVELASAA
ncbi:transposase InsO family protein [Bradyrhizobium sp. CIR18]|nr:transposase InsO family protein [Bradyrhizobium sp. CIR18]